MPSRTPANGLETANQKEKFQPSLGRFDLSSYYFSQAFEASRFHKTRNFFRDALSVGRAIRIDAERVKIVPLQLESEDPPGRVFSIT
jgi:hypothetical protein